MLTYGIICFQIFGFKQIAEHAELPNAFMIGAGAGPAHVIGVNSEVGCYRNCIFESSHQKP